MNEQKWDTYNLMRNNCQHYAKELRRFISNWKKIDNCRSKELRKEQRERERIKKEKEEQQHDLDFQQAKEKAIALRDEWPASSSHNVFAISYKGDSTSWACNYWGLDEKKKFHYGRNVVLYLRHRKQKSTTGDLTKFCEIACQGGETLTPIDLKDNIKSYFKSRSLKVNIFVFQSSKRWSWAIRRRNIWKEKIGNNNVIIWT